MRSLFAARQRYVNGRMSKEDFNRLAAEHVFKKWIPIAQNTEPCWRWLCELSAYLELKHQGYE